ncbi:MAG TPA: hypothetical protein VFA41_03765 [Ktedonobacteraceae bacterium]|jgi:photosystem II stability/assembly factor-like uncharacterized protein|nr:hypothetical protein [Ktedonobacteraceae bacterium]
MTNEYIPEERRPENERILRDLQRMYPSHAQVEQSLARVRQRLASFEIEEIQEQRPSQEAGSLYPVHSQKRPARYTRYFSVLAVLVVAVLIGSLLLVLNHVTERPRPGSPTLIPTPSMQKMGGWFQINMMNATTGWIAAENGILRTTDGGQHWKPVWQCWPSYKQSSNYIACDSSFDSATSATVNFLLRDQSGKFQGNLVAHTSDGGNTWQTAVINVQALHLPVQFVDALHGWIIGANPTGKIVLLRTLDGGKSWQQLLPGPHITSISDMHFRDASNGWISGITKTDVDTSWIIQTHDGGQTWQPLSLSLPPNTDISPFHFFNKQEGVFLLQSNNNNSYTTAIYATHDGGNTWSWVRSLPLFLQPENFIDLNHLWRRGDDIGDKVILTSSDGGLHWTTVSMQASFPYVQSFSFVSPSLAFALDGKIGPSFTFASGVFKTSDGGHTWQEIARVGK